MRGEIEVDGIGRRGNGGTEFQAELRRLSEGGGGFSEEKSIYM